MSLFLSTYRNKLDKKGRVSVPAPYRTILNNQSFKGIIAYGSFINECIEACGMQRIEKLYQTIDQLDPFSEEHNAFTTTILGGSVQLSFDSEGRVLLPEQLIALAHIKDQAIFVGKGHTFEIWEPERFATFSKEARKLAKTERATLRLSSNDRSMS